MEAALSHPYSDATPSTGEPGDKSGLAFLARSLRRRWRSTAAMTVGLSAASIAVIAVLPPHYSASAYLQVDSRPNVVSIPTVLPSIELDVGGISSEVEILKSRELAEAVAGHLHLAEIPGAKSHTSWLSGLPQLHEMAAEVKDWLGIRTPPPHDRVVTWLMDHSDIKPLGKSRVVRVSFTADSPETARDVANAYAQAYIARQVSQLDTAARGAKTWVDTEIGRVRGQVREDEHNLETFRARHGLTEDDSKLLLPYGQLADLDRDLTHAKADYAAARARVDEVRRLQRKGDLEGAVPESIDTPPLKALREQEANLTIERDGLLQHYAPTSGRVKLIEDERDQVRQSIQAELTRIAGGLQSEAAIAASQVASLQAAVTAAKSGLQGSGDLRVELAGLERTAEASRQVLVTLLKRRSELDAQTSLHTANARLVSPAALPHKPSFPLILPMALLATVGSFATAAGISAARDLKDRVIRSTDELAALVAFRTLGILPRFEPARRPNRLIALSADRSRFSEAVKNLYIRVAQPGHPLPRTIVVTSALSGEGKTTTAVSLAMLAATLGRKVALVDFDTHAPSIHHILQLPLGPGLADYVLGKTATLGESLNNPLPNLAVLTAGRADGFNVLARAERIEALMAELAQDFDHIVVDTPPCLAVVDSLVLARIADQVVHVVRWAHTSREVVKAAAHLFDRLDPDRIGVVLTQVDIKCHASEGYSDSVFYHKSLNRYYLG